MKEKYQSTILGYDIFSVVKDKSLKEGEKQRYKEREENK